MFFALHAMAPPTSDAAPATRTKYRRPNLSDRRPVSMMPMEQHMVQTMAKRLAFALGPGTEHTQLFQHLAA